MAEPILDVRNLRVSFPTEDGIVKAVDGVSLTLERGRGSFVAEPPAPLDGDAHRAAADQLAVLGADVLAEGDPAACAAAHAELAALRRSL